MSATTNAIFIVLLVALTRAQEISLPSLSNEDYEDEEEFKKEILVIPNRFPSDLNFFCHPKTDLMRDRLCFGQLDAFALACSDDTPPLQLVPFCLAFKDQCSKLTYPPDEMCKIEKRKFKQFCTRSRRNSCKSCKYGYDVSCTCEPYECIWRRHGYETARWCQQYELFCNKNERREKGSELVSLMKDAVKVHHKCMHMFNLPRVICHPFRRQFDWHRCMKFLFDCELISDFSEEDLTGTKEKKIEEKIEVKEKENEKKTKITEKEEIKETVKGGETVKEKVTTKEEIDVKKVDNDEKLFEKLIKESEKQQKEGPIKNPFDNSSDTSPPHPFASVKLPANHNETTIDEKVVVVEKVKEHANIDLPKEEVAKKIAEEEKLLEKLIQEEEKQSANKATTTAFPTLVPSASTSEHPFARVTLKPMIHRN